MPCSSACSTVSPKAGKGIRSNWPEFADPALLQERFDTLDRLKDAPREFLDAMAIEYRAPCDASASGLPAESIDCHISNTVFEHIPPAVLSAILVEGHRLMKDDGVAVHFIDPAIIFSTRTPPFRAPTSALFGGRMGSHRGQSFAYTNRLRRSELVRIFTDAGVAALPRGMSHRPEGWPMTFPSIPCMQTLTEKIFAR